jgi:hypothetical protein
LRLFDRFDQQGADARGPYRSFIGTRAERVHAEHAGMGKAAVGFDRAGQGEPSIEGFCISIRTTS